jgi:hypothetical protein
MNKKLTKHRPRRSSQAKVARRIRYGIDGAPDALTPVLIAVVRDRLAKEDYRWDTQGRPLPNADARTPENRDLWEGCSPALFMKYTTIARNVIADLAAELPGRMRDHLLKRAGLKK